MCESDHLEAAHPPAAAPDRCGDKHPQREHGHAAEAAGERQCRNCPDCVRRKQAAAGRPIEAAIPA